jgi:hypothetical protein
MPIFPHEAIFPHISPLFGQIEVRNIPIVATQGS